MDVVLFLIFSAVALGCAINLVLQRHPIACALSLVGVMGSLAVLYLLLGGEFLAAVQLIVYAGAIMVLFVFVIMLLNAGAERKARNRALWPAVGVPLFALLAGAVGWLAATQAPRGETVRFGQFVVGPAELGRALFTSYLLPFEVTSVLILIAILGAMVLARKEL
jgi:NADH-quinone oxidoreductase subunit J